MVVRACDSINALGPPTTNHQQTTTTMNTTNTRQRTEVERYGRRVVKYCTNTDGPRHLVLMQYAGLYFAYIMHGGVQVDRNGREVPGDTVTGSKSPGKYWQEYRNSSLNECHPA